MQDCACDQISDTSKWNLRIRDTRDWKKTLSSILSEVVLFHVHFRIDIGTKVAVHNSEVIPKCTGFAVYTCAWVFIHHKVEG